MCYAFAIIGTWHLPLKAVEFGRTLQLVQDSSGIILHYEIHQGNPSDRTELLSLVRQTKRDLGIKPKALTTDRGYYSTHNVLALGKAGIQRVGIPKVGRLSRKENRHQQAKWFRQLQRFRCGIEASIIIVCLNASSGWVGSWRKGLKPPRSGLVLPFSPTTCGSERD